MKNQLSQLKETNKKMEERVTNTEVQKEVKSDPAPKRVTIEEPLPEPKKRKSGWLDSDLVRTVAMGGLALGSYMIQNYKRPTPAPPPQPQPETRPQPQPETREPRPEPRQPYVRPLNLVSRNNFI